MKSQVYLVTGTAGTGKTTVMREISKQGIEVIGIDETPGLTAWIHKESGEVIKPGVELTDQFLKTHDWGCNVGQLRELLEGRKETVFVCGSCDNIDEIMALCDRTFVLVCEPEVFLPRIEQRTNNEYGKTEEAKRQLLGYYQSYRNECIEAGAMQIDASLPIEKVTQQILDNVK
jgi:thymidylate kinase